MKEFRRLSTGKLVDLLKEISTFNSLYPNGKIYVSTDSQVKGGKVKYATVVVLHKVDENGKGMGANVMYKLERDVRKTFGKSSGKDFVKLYKETDLSIETSNYIREQLNIDVDFIELDYNSDPYYFSNTVLLAAIGYVKALGFAVRGKPALASYAADKLAKGAY